MARKRQGSNDRRRVRSRRRQPKRPAKGGVGSFHLPSFGRGCTWRSQENDVSSDRKTFRTVLRDSLRLPDRLALDEVLTPYPTDPASPTARFAPKRAAKQTASRGVNFGRRSPASGGHFSTPDHNRPVRRLLRLRTQAGSQPGPRHRATCALHGLGQADDRQGQSRCTAWSWPSRSRKICDTPSQWCRT